MQKLFTMIAPLSLLISSLSFANEESANQKLNRFPVACRMTGDRQLPIFLDVVEDLGTLNSDDVNLKTKINVSFGLKRETLVGVYQTYDRNNAPLEFVSSEAMRELNLAEWDMHQTKMYYVAETEDAPAVALTLTVIQKEDESKELRFAGAYGMYRGDAFLCKKL